MIVHQVYALISEEKIQNICVCDNYDTANHIAKASYGSNAFAIDCLQYPVHIGDSYKDGSFYRENESGEIEVIEYVPTAEEQIILIQEELINTQLALIELYEGGSN